MEHRGWVLDLYEHAKDGAVLWLLGDDGERTRFWQPFPVTFYAAGGNQDLRALWRYLRAQPGEIRLSRQMQRDLFQPQPIPVLAAQVGNPAALKAIFHPTAQQFPQLTYYNADIPFALRFAAVQGVFPLVRCVIEADEQGRIQSLRVLDSPWELDPTPPPIRQLQLRPDSDPQQKHPQSILAAYQHSTWRFPLHPARPLLVGLAALLRRVDPDLLLTTWGDSWLLPYVLKESENLGIDLPLNREPGLGVMQRPERTYHAYGKVVYRGPKLTLFGRWHIDAMNAVMFHEYALEGVYEMARVTGLPVQTAARVSPGTGISAMQIRTALQTGVLVPWHKQQAEAFKSTRALLHSDQGGMVYQPVIGLHADVAEIDFTSMYPSIMVHFNISPETVGADAAGAGVVPGIDLPIDLSHQGLIPQTLAPLLEKRIALKTRLLELDPRDGRYASAKARVAAHKWLLVTCFGYLGYKNARFGRIEAHEAVTAYGREALLLAKEAAEDLGYRVLHMYVDGLWVQKAGIKTVAGMQPLLEEILTRTGLPLVLEGIYRWVAFLPSRSNPRVPVANRYFGVFQDGRLKQRGIETRRRDTPPFIQQMQQELLGILARAPSTADLPAMLPQIVGYLHSRLTDLNAGHIPPAELLVTQQLSRELDQYRLPSPAARAVAQMVASGKTVSVGQYVRFWHLRAGQVHAWASEAPLQAEAVDMAYYSELLLRAAHTILQPLGVEEQTLRHWLFSNAGYGAPPGVVADNRQQCWPLFSSIEKTAQTIHW